MTTQITEAFRSGMCLHTSRAIDRLKDGKPGDSITRDEMAVVVGRPCEPGDKGYGNVGSAIRKVEREHGIVWRWDRTTQAWVCYDDHRKVVETGSGIARARKIAGRAMRVAAGVTVANLTPDELKQHSRNIALAGLMQMAGGGEVQKKLADVAEVKQPDIKAFIGMFK